MYIPFNMLLATSVNGPNANTLSKKVRFGTKKKLNGFKTMTI